MRVRSVNDCPTRFLLRNGRSVDASWMVGAYVNEEHPWIDQLLREALNTGAIRLFRGYQGPPAEVFQQVFAIWDVLQRRGFRYSNIVTTSSGSVAVDSQYVRFLE